MKNIIIFLISILILGCNSNNLKKQLDAWVVNLCCDDSKGLIKIKSFSVGNDRGINIKFCESFKEKVSISLNFWNGTDYDILIDIYSVEAIQNDSIQINKTFPLGFKGKIQSIKKFNDGEYWLYLGFENACGEIKFTLKDGVKIKEELVCLERCQLRN